jgi:hypothetical protein
LTPRCCAQRQPVHDGIHVFPSFFGVDRGSLLQLPLAQRTRLPDFAADAPDRAAVGRPDLNGGVRQYDPPGQSALAARDGNCRTLAATAAAQWR